MESERKAIAFDPGNLTGIDGVSGVKEHQQGCYHYRRKRRTCGETATKHYSNSVRQPDFYSYQTHQIPQETNPHRKPGKTFDYVYGLLQAKWNRMRKTR